MDGTERFKIKYIKTTPINKSALMSENITSTENITSKNPANIITMAANNAVTNDENDNTVVLLEWKSGTQRFIL